MKIPPEHLPDVDALLRGLDPRLDPGARETALMTLLESAPEFALGALSQIVIEYHAAAEQLANLPVGTFVDRLRSNAFADRSPEQILGYAINDPQDPAAALRTGEPQPIPFQVRPDAPMIPNPAQAGAEALPSVTSSPRARALLDRLRAARLDEAAVDAGLDDPRTAEAALAGAGGLTPAYMREGDLTASDGGNQPQQVTCDVATDTGPCVLAAGHLELPIPGTVNGHMSADLARRKQ